jgi:hypothetical protein
LVELTKEKENGKFKKKKKRNVPWTELIIIDPHTMWYQIFKIIIVISSIYSSLLYAVVAAFRFDLDYASYD